MLAITLTIQSNEKWPKDLPISNQYNGTKTGMMEEYKYQLEQHKDDVFDFVEKLRSKVIHLPQSNCTNEFCEQFVTITGLQSDDFYLYQGYIESVLDSVIAVKPNNEQPLFGYSFAIRNNIPDAKDVYNYIQKVAYASEPLDSQYTAFTIAGLNAYYTVYDKKENAFVAITRDMGTNSTYPDYDDQTQSNDVNNFAFETASSYLYNFYYNQQSGLVQYMYSYVSNNTNEIVAIYDNSSVTNDFQLFKSTQSGTSYTRKTNSDGFQMEGDTYSTTSFVQTFQEAIAGKVITSDYRIVQMEKALTGLADQISLSSWWSSLNQYPMRTQTTPSMVAFSAVDENQELYLTKCNSVYDAQGNTAACENPPVPVSVASIVCSIIIIDLVIAAWVYGCIEAKKYDKLNQPQNQ